MSALAAMQDKTTHLENSLSAETRLKLDLFSALGEAKRQMEIHHGTTVQSCFDIESRIRGSLNLLPVILIATGLKLLSFWGSIVVAHQDIVYRKYLT